MRHSRRLTLALLLCCVAWPAAALGPAGLVAGFPRGQAILVTAGPRCLLLDLYFAVSDAQRSQGLMHVEKLDEFEGMYFAYREPVELTMWMKNTVLPLDMVFIREDGTVGPIARDTVPYSTARISSGEPVAGVLEVNAGFARRWRVERGTGFILY